MTPRSAGIEMNRTDRDTHIYRGKEMHFEVLFVNGIFRAFLQTSYDFRIIFYEYE